MLLKYLPIFYAWKLLIMVHMFLQGQVSLTNLDFKGLNSVAHTSDSKSVHLCTVVCIETMLLCTEILLSSENIFILGIYSILF